MKKFSPLKFIQIAWVAETIAVIIYTFIILPILSLERMGLWLQFFPHVMVLIGAQGTAAGIGPLMADKIKSNGGKNE